MPALAAASSSSGSGWSILILLLPVLLLAFLFMTNRKRQRQMQVAQQELTVGDEISTTSGLLGTLVAIDDQVATIDVGQGIQLRFDRRAVVPRTVTEATRPAVTPSETTGDEAAVSLDKTSPSTDSDTKA